MIAGSSGTYDVDALADSPYRVRGSLYLGTRTYFEANVPGGYGALLAALRPALRTFMAQPFKPRSFYEVMDAPELIDVEARVCGLSVPRYLDRRTRWQAQRDLSGLTGVVLRQGDLTMAILAADLTNLTPAFASGSGVESWQRHLDFSGGQLRVTDEFSVTSGTQAIFQVNTPQRPLINGRNATAGRLQIRVLEPADAVLTAVEWSAVDGDFDEGWKLEVRGGASNTGFVVELGTGEAIFDNGFE